jgi:hypothetical protein
MAQQNNSGPGTVLGMTSMTITAIAGAGAGAVVVLAVAIVAAWRIMKYTRAQRDSNLLDSTEMMPTEEGTGFSAFSQDLSSTCYENPNELEGMDMVNSDGLATEIVDSDLSLVDDPDELL